MSEIVEFIYAWALSGPHKHEFRNDDGTYTIVYSNHSLKAAVMNDPGEKWGLPSGRHISVEVVNEFLEKYTI